MHLSSAIILGLWASATSAMLLPTETDDRYSPPGGPTTTRAAAPSPTALQLDSNNIQYLPVTDPDFFGGQNIQILIPPSAGNTANSIAAQNPADAYKSSLTQSLPFLLRQLGVKESDISGMVAEGIPMITQAVFAAFNGSSFNDTSLITRDLEGRGCWPGFLCQFAQNLRCGIFAAAALPGYLLTEQAFRLFNLAIGDITSYPEEFYLRPTYGDLSRSAGISLYRNAHYPPGYVGSAITLGRRIYIRPGYNTASWSLNNPSGANQAAFQSSVRLLLHEMKHIKQESETSFLPGVFGLRYLFEYCKVSSNPINLPTDLVPIILTRHSSPNRPTSRTTTTISNKTHSPWSTSRTTSSWVSSTTTIPLPTTTVPSSSRTG